ncbi:MAG: DNA-binding protein [Candidatus Omnitrophota bacterium]
MKKKNIGFFIILTTTYYLLTTVVYAQSISSTELISNARAYDGKQVVYEGEAIGDIMVRGNYAWLNINDGYNAIGAWISAEMARGIVYTGSYKSRGDAIEVSGIFNRACPEHGGDLDIHVQVMRKIANGRAVREKLNQDKLNFVITLGVICVALGILWTLMRFKEK